MESSRKAVIGLFLLACALRLATVGVALQSDYHPSRQLREDMGSYVALAVSLVKGEGFSHHYYESLPEFFKDPEHVKPSEPARPTAIKAIGYPLFLAALFRVGGFHLTPIVSVQALISSLSTLLVYWIGRRVGSVRVGLIAMGIAAVYYPFWHDAVTLLTETLLTFLTLLALYGLVRWLLRPSLANGFFTGLALGAGFLVRPFLLPLAPCLVGVGFFRHRPPETGRSFGVSTLAMGVGVVLLLAPWAIRNHRLSGGLLVTPSFGGYYLLNLYNRFNRDFLSYSDPGFVNEGYPGFHDRLLPELKLSFSSAVPPVKAERLQDEVYARSAIRFIRDHPGQFLKSLPRTFWNTWRWDYPRANPLRKGSNLLFYLGLVPFFLLGIGVGIRQRNVPALLLTGFMAYFLVFHTVTISQIRYRTLAMPAFFLLASLGLDQRLRRC